MDKCSTCEMYTGDFLATLYCSGCGGDKHYVSRKAPLISFHAGRTSREYCLGFGVGIREKIRVDITDAYYFSIGLLLVWWYVNIGIRVRRGEAWRAMEGGDELCTIKKSSIAKE